MCLLEPLQQVQQNLKFQFRQNLQSRLMSLSTMGVPTSFHPCECWLQGIAAGVAPEKPTGQIHPELRDHNKEPRTTQTTSFAKKSTGWGPLHCLSEEAQPLCQLEVKTHFFSQTSFFDAVLLQFSFPFLFEHMSSFEPPGVLLAILTQCPFFPLMQS